jgi:GntR family transcriptional regulator / MocR family aminotransferase
VSRGSDDTSTASAAGERLLASVNVGQPCGTTVPSRVAATAQTAGGQALLISRRLPEKVVSCNDHLQARNETTIVHSMRTAPGIFPVVAIDRSSATPLYRQLYESYRDAIVERRLRAGQRVPSTRSLAAELQISRIPVLNAFEQLLAEGYLESRVGSGTFVARSLPDLPPRPSLPPAARRPAYRQAPRVISPSARALLGYAAGPWLRGKGAFHVGEPPIDRFPVRVWSQLTARHSRKLTEAELHYGDSRGFGPLREAVAEYLRTARAVRCEAEQIVIVAGSQQALALAARVLVDRGEPLWLEDPAYFGARNVFTSEGVRIVPVPVDEEGLDVSAGIARCKQASAVFVTPSHQFPLGVTMSASRRLQLLNWASATGSWIIEDDYDSEYRYESLPIASLQGLDREARVVYIGTFAKILFPAIRLGYLVLPPDLVDPFIQARRAMDICPPTFLQAVLADFIGEGHFARHIRRTREVCRERRRTLLESLRSEFGNEIETLGDDAGMFLTAALPDGWVDRKAAEAAAREGLLVFPLSELYLGAAPTRSGFVLGFGGTGVAEIRTGVRQLRRIVLSEAASARGRRTARGSR